MKTVSTTLGKLRSPQEDERLNLSRRSFFFFGAILAAKPAVIIEPPKPYPVASVGEWRRMGKTFQQYLNAKQAMSDGHRVGLICGSASCSIGPGNVADYHAFLRVHESIRRLDASFRNTSIVSADADVFNADFLSDKFLKGWWEEPRS